MTTNQRHIAVIDPGTRVPELDAYNRLAKLTKLRLSYHLPALFGMGSIEDIGDKFDGIVVFGSGASVHDTYEWQSPFHRWLEAQITAKTPVLGICYGHQLLAHLFGGKVGFVREDQVKLLGGRELTFTQDGFWGAKGERAQFIVSHKECVKSLSADCDIFAQSSEVMIDGFYHKHLPVWGIQPHPEAGHGFVRNQDIPLPHNFRYQDGPRFLEKFFHMIELNQERLA